MALRGNAPAPRRASRWHRSTSSIALSRAPAPCAGRAAPAGDPPRSRRENGAGRANARGTHALAGIGWPIATAFRICADRGPQPSGLACEARESPLSAARQGAGGSAARSPAPVRRSLPGQPSRYSPQVPRIGLERGGKSPRPRAGARDTDRAPRRAPRRLFHDANQATTPIFPLPSRSTTGAGRSDSSTVDGSIQGQGRPSRIRSIPARGAPGHIVGRRMSGSSRAVPALVVASAVPARAQGRAHGRVRNATPTCRLPGQRRARKPAAWPRNDGVGPWQQAAASVDNSHWTRCRSGPPRPGRRRGRQRLARIAALEDRQPLHRLF